MKKRLPFILLIIAGMLLLRTNLVAQAWKLAGNSLAGTEKLGSTNNFPVRFFANNTQRMTLTPAGYLGVGTTLPEANLHILRGRAAAITADSNSTLVVESDHDNFISLLATSTKKSAIIFGSTILALDAGIIYNSAGNTRGLAFNTNGDITRMVLTGTGFLGIGTKTPKTNLHVYKGSSGVVTPNASSTLVVENSSDNFINVLAPGTNKSGILFGNNSNAQDAGVIYNSASAPNGMQFNTNGNVTRMVLTNAGYLGVGTNTPQTKLHVFYGSSGAATVNPNATLAIENSWDNYINVLAPNANETGILFGNAASTAHGGIIYNNVGVKNGLQFRTNNNVTRMVLTSAGHLGIGTSAPAVDLHLIHADGVQDGAVTHGFRIQNAAADGYSWTFFHEANSHHLLLYSVDQWAGLFSSYDGDYYSTLSNSFMKAVESSPNVLQSLMQLEVKKYQSIEDKPGSKKPFWMISKEVEKVFPEIVSHINRGGEDHLMVNKSAYGIIAIKAIQEQQAVIQSQQVDIAEMKAMIKELKARIDQLSPGTSSNSNTASLNNKVVECSGAQLAQNTPNPFKATTVISYYLPDNKGNASIEVLSSNGKLLKTFPLTQQGNGQLLIKAGTLASGTYYYALMINGKKVDSKQMIITK